VVFLRAMNRLRSCVALLTLGVAAGGCQHRVRPGEREESFRPFLTLRVGEVSLPEFLTQRTALLISGAVPGKVEGTHGSWDIQLALAQGRSAEIGLGTALAISSEGHFLTAAHNLTRPPFAVAIVRNGRVEWAEAKVLWSGAAGVPEEDFAVLQAPVHPAGVFRWDDADPLREGMEVALMSSPHPACGGRLLQSTPYSSPSIPCAVRCTVLGLPVIVGDSGGPVVGKEGQFIGLVVLSKGNLAASPESLAVRPDWHWVANLVGSGK